MTVTARGRVFRFTYDITITPRAFPRRYSYHYDANSDVSCRGEIEYGHSTNSPLNILKTIGEEAIMMHTSVVDLRYKEIINLNSGQRLGFVCDVEISLPEGKVTALIVPGTARFFGLFGREDDLIIPWDRITKIGADIILVDVEGQLQRHHRREKKRSFF